MHLPAWKPDIIILNSGGTGTYNLRAGDWAVLEEKEGVYNEWVMRKDRGKNCPTVWIYGVKIQFAHLLLY